MPLLPATRSAVLVPPRPSRSPPPSRRPVERRMAASAWPWALGPALATPHPRPLSPRIPLGWPNPARTADRSARSRYRWTPVGHRSANTHPARRGRSVTNAVTHRWPGCAARGSREFPAPSLLPIRSRCAHSRPRFHPHLGTTLWMRTLRPVDGGRRSGGQPVSSQGTGARPAAPSTAPPRCPPPVPRRRPHHATPADLRRSRPSTLCTGAGTTAGSLFHMN